MTKTELKKYGGIAEAATYQVLFTNDLVMCAVVDLKDLIRNSEFNKYSIKKNMNSVSFESARYEKLTARVIAGNISFFADANEKFQDGIQSYVNTFLYSIKNVFDKERTSNAALYSQLEYTTTLCGIAVAQIERNTNYLRSVDPFFNRFSLDYLSLKKVLFGLKNIEREMGKKITKKVDLDSDKNCKLALNILIKKLADSDIISAAIKE